MSATPAEVLAYLTRNPALTTLSARCLAVAQAAARQKRRQILAGEEVAELTEARLAPLDDETATTPYGNLLHVLDHGPRSLDEWHLVGALCAVAYAELWGEPERRDECFSELVWLGTHTPCDPWSALDALLDDEGRTALFERLATLTQDSSCPEGQSTALLALVRGQSDQAYDAMCDCMAKTTAPRSVELLATRVRAEPLEGRLSSERGPVRTVVYAVTGLLLLGAVGRVVARYVLGLSRRGTLTFSPRGLQVDQSLRVLGTVVAESTQFIPLDQLASVRRTTRYDGAGLYLGLATLGLGSYAGMGLIADSVRAAGGSLSLLAFGCGALTVSIILDFLLTRFWGWRRGVVRLIAKPRRGRGVSLNGVSPHVADSLLEQLSHTRGFSRF